MKKQSKKIIQSLQMCPKMASLRERNMLISLIYSPEKGHYVYL